MALAGPGARVRVAGRGAGRGAARVARPHATHGARAAHDGRTRGRQGPGSVRTRSLYMKPCVFQSRRLTAAAADPILAAAAAFTALAAAAAVAAAMGAQLTADAARRNGPNLDWGGDWGLEGLGGSTPNGSTAVKSLEPSSATTSIDP